jgi:hypothetical protein
MGMYTEFYFRANIKEGEVADWLHTQINGGGDSFQTPFDEHEFFTSDRWSSVFIGGGAVYQESRRPIFRRKSDGGEPYHHQLILASSLKNYGSEIESFVEWITPHLDMHEGEFLGYSLYEDSDGADDSEQWREHPTLYFHKRESQAS